MGTSPSAAIIGGLGVFGFIFAINSAVHSFLILDYTEGDKVALNVGFYYMANAGGRLIGCLLSGLLFQAYGLAGCLWGAALFAFGGGRRFHCPPHRRHPSRTRRSQNPGGRGNGIGPVADETEAWDYTQIADG